MSTATATGTRCRPTNGGRFRLFQGENMANWFYLAGSICFAVGTIINIMK